MKNPDDVRRINVAMTADEWATVRRSIAKEYAALRKLMKRTRTREAAGLNSRASSSILAKMADVFDAWAIVEEAARRAKGEGGP